MEWDNVIGEIPGGLISQPAMPELLIANATECADEW